MDFAFLPPEINSGRMYVGPGSGPMLAAAAAWDGLATELHSTATSYGSVIAATRALLQALVATNLFGQNSPAIAATEALYAEMWAQDATAMYGYAGTSASATTLTPFTPAPQTTNGTSAAASTQAAAAQATSTAVQGLSS